MPLSEHVFLAVPCLACGKGYQLSLSEIRARCEVGAAHLVHCSSCAATAHEQLLPISAIAELERAWSHVLDQVQARVDVR